MKITPARSIFDHLLVTLGATMGVFAAFMSLGQPGNALFFGFAVIVTSMAGYALGWAFRNSAVVRLDAWLWAGLAVIATTQVLRLHQFVPDPETTRNLIIVPVLSWMIVLCSLVSWRDQTLLFVTLPSLALFGLVGTFENYPPGTVMFFGFLIASALLYARVHHRGMIERAQASGIQVASLLYRDAWRWMAGPEWALASAGAIVLLSLIAAPLIQFSLQGVSGRVEVRLPADAQQTAQSGNSEAPDRPVGQGPIRLDDTPVFKIQTPRLIYLRLDSFTYFSQNGWRGPNQDWGVDALPSPMILSIDRVTPAGGVLLWPGGIAPGDPVSQYERLRIRVRSVGATLPALPSPGPIVEVYSRAPAMRVETNGAVRLPDGFPPGMVVDYDVAIPTVEPQMEPSTLPTPLAGSLAFTQMNPSDVSDRFINFVTSATESAVTPFEKADALEKAIAAQARYNVRAPRIPAGESPVDYFLFQSRQGYCDLFATTMVLGARVLGLPARYATGYIINDASRDSNGYFTIRARDAHAWAEIYFQNVGWVVFDPTEHAVAVEGAERGSANAEVPWWREPAFAWILNVLMALGVVAVVVLLVLNRGGARLGAVGATERPEVARLHAAFQRAIEAHVRFPRRFSMTTAEFVHVAAPHLGPAAERARRMADEFQRAFYAQAAPSPAEIRRLGGDLRALRAELKAQKRGAA